MISWNIINRFTLVTSAILVFSYHAYSQDTSTGNMTVKQSEYNDALLSDGLKIELAKLEIKVEATGRRYKILSVAGKIKEKEARAVYDEYVTLQIELETLNEKLATTLIEEEKNRLDAEKAKVKADMKAKAEQDRRDAIREAEQDRQSAEQEMIYSKRAEEAYKNRAQKVAGVHVAGNIGQYENAKKVAIDKTYMVSYWAAGNNRQNTGIGDLTAIDPASIKRREIIVDDTNGNIIGVALVGPANVASNTLNSIQYYYPNLYTPAPNELFEKSAVEQYSYTTRLQGYRNIILKFQWDGSSDFMISLYDPDRCETAKTLRDGQ